jgi:K+/H+ antiporter YhaU regulatory subunit KhtT
MLMGNAGIVTAMSSLIISFVNMEGNHPLVWRILLLMTGLVALWAVASSEWVDHRLSKLISKALKRYTTIDVRDYASMLHLAGEYQISEIQVDEDDWMAGRSLADLHLSNEGVMVLGITRKSGIYVGAPMGDTRVHPYDTLMVYGRASSIESLDKRKQGGNGDIDHSRMVAQQTAVQQGERQGDSAPGRVRSAPKATGKEG